MQIVEFGPKKPFRPGKPLAFARTQVRLRSTVQEDLKKNLESRVHQPPIAIEHLPHHRRAGILRAAKRVLKVEHEQPDVPVVSERVVVQYRP